MLLVCSAVYFAETSANFNPTHGIISQKSVLYKRKVNGLPKYMGVYERGFAVRRNFGQKLFII
jgi:hypothetical protein